MKKMILMLAILALLLSSTFSFAKQPIKFEIGGIKLGEVVPAAFINSTCPGIDAGRSGAMCRKMIKVGYSDVTVIHIIDKYVLISVALSFDSSLYDTMVETYTTKFGQLPNSSTESTVVTGMGVPYTNKISVWNTIDGKFTIQKYSDNVTEGIAVICSPAYEKYDAEKTAKTQKELGSQL